MPKIAISGVQISAKLNPFGLIFVLRSVLHEACLQVYFQIAEAENHRDMVVPNSQNRGFKVLTHENRRFWPNRVWGPYDHMSTKKWFIPLKNHFWGQVKFQPKNIFFRVLARILTYKAP